MPALTQATRIPHADGGQVIVDFLLGQSGAGIDDAHDALGSIGMHFDARLALPVGLFQTATQDRVVRVLHQLAQRDHRRGIQMLAENGHQSVEIDACAADLGGVRRLGGVILHDRSSFPWRPRPSSDAPSWVAVRAAQDSRKPPHTHARHTMTASRAWPARGRHGSAPLAERRTTACVDAWPWRATAYRCKVSIGASLKCWR